MHQIVYNVTVKVRWDILEDWLVWQLEEQIPAVLATKLFDAHRFYRLLEQDEEEGPTFVVQYLTSSLERYQQFIIEFAPVFQQDGWERWGNGFIAFRTLMSMVETIA
jgi:Domain of unknown function (DUF4286)